MLLRAGHGQPNCLFKIVCVRSSFRPSLNRLGSIRPTLAKLLNSGQRSAKSSRVHRNRYFSVGFARYNTANKLGKEENGIHESCVSAGGRRSGSLMMSAGQKGGRMFERGGSPRIRHREPQISVNRFHWRPKVAMPISYSITWGGGGGACARINMFPKPCLRGSQTCMSLEGRGSQKSISTKLIRI